MYNPSVPAPLLGVVVAALLAGAPQASPAQAPQSSQTPPPERLTLQSAFTIAEEHNRTLVAARLGRAVDVAGVGVAGQRPNPEASFEAGRDTPHEVLSLAIPLELGGKRARRLDVANATLARTTAELVVQSLDIRRTVRLAYFELVTAASRVQVTADLRGFAERTRNAARDRFESGAAPRLEALQAELALGQADNEAENARGRLLAARVAINTALGRPPDAAVEAGDAFDTGDIPADLPALVAAGPDIAALDRQIDEAVARERLALAMRRPDPTLSGGVLFDARPEFMYGWRGGLAITIPVFTRHTADVRIETARVAQLKATREARVAALVGDAAGASARAQAARRQYQRYRDEIVPQLAAVEAMAEDSYRSGQTNLTAFLQALQAAREVRLRATDAGQEYQTALADLERALGGPIR